MPFSAAILAGGYSSRFGQDKARYVFAGKPMLEHVKASLKHADEMFIIANRAYDEFKLTVHADLVPQQGPLSGIHAALHHANYDWVAVAACDMPYLTQSYWQELQTYTNDKQSIIIVHNEKLEPLAAFYHKRMLKQIEKQLRSGEKAVHDFIKTQDACIVNLNDLDLSHQVLHNINSLDTLEPG